MEEKKVGKVNTYQIGRITYYVESAFSEDENAMTLSEQIKELLIQSLRLKEIVQ